MKNDDNLLTDMSVPSAFFKLAIPAFAALVSMGGAPKASRSRSSLIMPTRL